MRLVAHGEFIMAAYGAAVLILAALIVWIIYDYRALRRTLRAFEDEGVTRRSEQAVKSSP